MKRIAFCLGIAAALVASCSTQEMDFQTPVQENEVFYASFEQPADEGTRVYVNEDLLLRWTADDRVSIFNKNTYNQQYQFTGETGDNAGGFRKVDSDEFVTGNTITHVVSVYPYQERTKISEKEEITLTLPAVQHYAESSFGLNDNTMVAVSEDNFLQYKNLGGYLRLSLYGEGVMISSIRLKGNNGEKLAGKATVTMPVDGVPAVVLADDATDEITLVCETPVALGATVDESKNFWFVVPPGTFSNGFTIAVSHATGGIYEKATSKSITIERSNLSKMSPIDFSGIIPVTPVPEAVDLGLSVKWASFNLGATAPDGFGDYYAWGETEPYYSSLDPLIWKDGKETGYAASSYGWYSMLENKSGYTKYCPDPSNGIDGFSDHKTVLDPEDDAAHWALGGDWRIPTDTEFSELRTRCSWEWTSVNGKNGYQVTGPNGNGIFLPVAGAVYGTYLPGGELDSGYYWSSSLFNINYVEGPADDWNYASGGSHAWCLGCSSDFVGKSVYQRDRGLLVRPVYCDFITVESVSLNQASLTMTEGDSQALTAFISPSNATEKTVTWSSSNPSVAMVSPSGVVTAFSAGTATITAWASDGVHYATCPVSVQLAENGVDLGLSVRWATCNLGASKPDELGDYYAWGETEPYYEPGYAQSYSPVWKEGKESGYSWSSYKWCMGSETTLTKYCTDASDGYDEFVDERTFLDLADDAAYVALGGMWRMPTEDEFNELLNDCTWERISLNGITGYKVTGPNGNSIFLPSSGLRQFESLYLFNNTASYWSSSLYGGLPTCAVSVDLSLGYRFLRSFYRCLGLSVRPVYGEPSPLYGRILNITSGLSYTMTAGTAIDTSSQTIDGITKWTVNVLQGSDVIASFDLLVEAGQENLAGTYYVQTYPDAPGKADNGYSYVSWGWDIRGGCYYKVDGTIYLIRQGNTITVTAHEDNTLKFRFVGEVQNEMNNDIGEGNLLLDNVAKAQ